jgi:hypothetical protein
MNAVDPEPRQSFWLSKIRLLVFVGVTLLAAALLFSHPPWSQNTEYHQFADHRTLLGVPHFWNVVSNVPFLIVGLLGAVFVLRSGKNGMDGAFVNSWERWPCLVMFAGIGLTAFGSTYYHLAPDNDRLLWDRLPMALAFTGLFSGIIADRIGPRIGLALLGPLIALGIGSVIYWYYTDDLRLYYLVQFYPIIGIPLILLLFPPRYTGTSYLFAALGCYVLAKFCEHPLDAKIYYFLGQTLSGHTLKHLLAAVAAYWLLVMLQRRRPYELTR